LRHVCDVIFPPKNKKSKNKIGTICKNDMFYVYGKFRTISMKIKEVITPLAILDYFLPGVEV
jgi:hypothetical protein